MTVLCEPVTDLLLPERPPETLADLLDRLGGISPRRIAANPPPGTATVDDLLTPRSGGDHLYELVDGMLVEKAMGYYESVLATVLSHMIYEFLNEHDLGVVGGEAGLLQIVPGLVRGPDVSFIRWDRLPHEELPPDAFPGIAPDLAVEVISKGNTPGEMRRKLREYFDAGCRLVWYLYPEERVVRVYTGPEECSVVTEDGVLDGDPVLPGFSVPVREWLKRARVRQSDPR